MASPSHGECAGHLRARLEGTQASPSPGAPCEDLSRSGRAAAFLRFLKLAFSPTYRALPAPSNQAALIFKVAQPGQIQDLTGNANTAGMPLCHKG